MVNLGCIIAQKSTKHFTVITIKIKQSNFKNHGTHLGGMSCFKNKHLGLEHEKIMVFL